MLLVFLRVVRLIGADAVGGDQCAVNDDVVALTEAGVGFMEAWGPGGQHLQGLVHVAPGGGLRYREPGAELGERLVLAQVDKREQCLAEAAELPQRMLRARRCPYSSQATAQRANAGRRAWQDTEPTGPLRSSAC